MRFLPFCSVPLGSSCIMTPTSGTSDLTTLSCQKPYELSLGTISVRSRPNLLTYDHRYWWDGIHSLDWKLGRPPTFRSKMNGNA